MIKWSAWLPDILPHLPACHSVLAEHEIKRAAQEFFERSRAWSVTLERVGVGAGQPEIELAADDSGQDIVRVEKAWYDDKVIEPITVEQLDDAFNDDWTLHTGRPTKYVIQSPSVIRLYPSPDIAAASGACFRVSVRPSERSSGVPVDLGSKYRNAIVAGAKARLMMYPEKAWTRLDMAAVEMSVFNAAIDKANIDAARAHGAGRIPSRPRFV